MYGYLKLPKDVVVFYKKVANVDLSDVHYKSCDKGCMPYKKRNRLGYYDEEYNAIYIDTYMMKTNDMMHYFIPTLIHECMHMVQYHYGKHILFNTSRYRDEFISFKELAIIAKIEGDFVRFNEIGSRRINAIEKYKYLENISVEDFQENMADEIEAKIIEIIFMWQNFDLDDGLLYALYLENVLPVVDTDRFKFIEKSARKIFFEFYIDLNNSKFTYKEIERNTKINIK